MTMKTSILLGLLFLIACNSKTTSDMNFKEQFSDWMTRLSKSEKPSDNIVAFNFGLFETKKGFTIYLIGTRKFDKDDDDWATKVDFEPKDKYLEIDPKETKGLEWNEVQEKASKTIKEFMASNEFNNSILKDAKHITTGFDDGELQLIK